MRTDECSTQGRTRSPNVSRWFIRKKSAAGRRSIRPGSLRKLAFPNVYSAKVEIQAVGGKREVLKVLEWFRDHGGNPGNLFGLVDRDEWSSAIISLQTSTLTQLRVVASRDCLESYFADPDELEPSLLAENVAYTADVSDFRSLLETELPAFVDHWALFSTTERLKERLTSAELSGRLS